jgi:ring-1,2-phenylacetyl-CoA epoxidase subunit PaaE
MGALPRVGVREIPDGLFSRWLVRDVRPGDRVEVQTPSGRFRVDEAIRAEGGRHLCIAAGSGITPMLSIAGTVLAHPDASVTLLYGNRTTGSVMFAEELADLKDRYPARFNLVHVLSREPRNVDLFSGRLDVDRIRQLVDVLVPLADVDHVWLCGPFPMVTATRELLGSLGVPSSKVHVELFHVDEPPPELHHAEAVVEGDTSSVRRCRAHRPSSTRPPPSAATCRSPARAACAAPAVPGSSAARSTCAATTRSTTTSSPAASCSPARPTR